MSNRKVPQFTLATPPPETIPSTQSLLDSVYPLPIGDMTQDPLTQLPWWKFQTMYYHHLLRWHPDHPNTIDPADLDPHLLARPTAKLTLIIRDLVLESQKGLNINMRKEVPKEIVEILPLIQSLISLDFLTCMYTIFLPIMGNMLPIITWNHLYDMLQLILATMKLHTTSGSGIQPPPRLYKDPNYSHYNDISIPLKLSNVLTQLGGTIWKSDYRIIINIPSDKWIEYGQGHLNIHAAHNFEQVAWIQICQFHAKDLQDAIDQITLFEEISFSNKLWQEYKEKNQYKSSYLQLVYQCKIYGILEKWILAESQKALSIEQDNPINMYQPTLPSPSHNSLHPSTSPTINFTEEWEAISSSSYDSTKD